MRRERCASEAITSAPTSSIGLWSSPSVLRWRRVAFLCQSRFNKVGGMDTGATDRERELERIREFLVLLARLQIDPRFQGKVDLSGVVQQTLLEVHHAYDRFRTWDEAQKAAWLRKVLAHNLTDEVRKLRTAGRDVAREQPLEAGSSDRRRG